MSDVKLNVLTLGQRGNKKYQGQHRMFDIGNFDPSLKLHHIHSSSPICFLTISNAEYMVLVLKLHYLADYIE